MFEVYANMSCRPLMSSARCVSIETPRLAVFVRGRGEDLLVSSRNVIDAPLGIVLISFAMDFVVHSADHLHTHHLLSVMVLVALC